MSSLFAIFGAALVILVYFEIRLHRMKKSVVRGTDFVNDLHTNILRSNADLRTWMNESYPRSSDQLNRIEMTAQECSAKINSEAFIDELVDRIKRKQLP